jgi:hypothetical protein
MARVVAAARVRYYFASQAMPLKRKAVMRRESPSRGAFRSREQRGYRQRSGVCSKPP